MKNRSRTVGLLLFGSGMTALVYQTVWMRELRLIFGFSTAASAAVAAIFLGGIGAGSAILGRRANASERPLLFYGKLELAIAASAAASPLLLWLAREAYVALGGSFRLGMILGTIVRLLLSAVVLCVPTVLMGGSLPAASRAVESDEDPDRRRIAWIYGANTLGAVVGTMVSTFYLFEAFGNRFTLLFACVVNALVAVIAILLGQRSAAVAETGSTPAARPAHSPRAAEAGTLAPAGLVFACAAVVGFVFLLMELVWYRMLSPILGGSTYTFGLILAVALLGIGLGALAYARRSAARPPSFGAFAMTCALEAAFVALPFAIGDRIALLAILTRPLGGFGFAGYVASWALIASIVVLPAAVVAGYQFPLLVALLGQGRSNVARDVGYAYAWNTGGTIVGSLAGGFGLIQLLSAPGAWRLSVAVLAALGLASALVSTGRERRRSRAGWALGLAATAVAMIFSRGPTAAWRHTPIGAGRMEFNGPTPNRLREWARTQRRQLRWEADGRESSVAILGLDLGLAFAVNGKVDGSAVGDSATQVMGGLLGAALHPLPKSALVVGLGTGSTAGWLGAVSSIDRVDVVELEPAIRRVAEECAPVNRNVLQNPKVRILTGDARELLLTSRDRYDVVFSEPSNPYRAGISSLFTQQFYRSVADRLSRGGIFVQWLQAYEVDSPTVRTVYATLASVFPTVETYFSKKQDLLLVASDSPVKYPADALRERLRQEPYSAALLSSWRVSDLEGLLSHFLARDSLARSIAQAERGLVNTDDRNLVEFAFARSLGRSLFSSDELRDAAVARGEDKPGVEGAVDWENVERQRLSTQAADGVEPVGAGSSAVWNRRAAVFANFAGGRLGDAARAFLADPWEPQGALELAMVGESLADAGDQRILSVIRALEPVVPAEAQAILARLLWTRQDWQGCFKATKAAFERYRTDPWPVTFLMKRLLAIAASLPSKDPSLAGQLDDLLASRFCVNVLDEDRMLARLTIAQNRGAAAVAEALAPLEPNFPWSGDFLQLRARAYQETNDPRAETARREAEEFRAYEAVPFNTGLTK